VLTELASSNKVVGVKQSRKAIREGRAAKVFLATDADPAVTSPVEEACQEQGIPTEQSYGMTQLGKACRITVGAAVVVLLKEE
jgi:large subunit ribosomal protein L7A